MVNLKENLNLRKTEKTNNFFTALYYAFYLSSVYSKIITILF